MNGNLLTAIATTILAFVGFVQVFVLVSQKKQTRIALVEQYRQLWSKLKYDWGILILIGRKNGEYYQILNEASIKSINEKIKEQRQDIPTVWALESIRSVCGMISEVSIRLLQGHLKISDVYPIFGTEFLRQSRPLRQLLEPEYISPYYTDEVSTKHDYVRNEMQNWLTYHDGTRRRCLIFIDLLWAEAARLEDLPPCDIKSAADAKKVTGKLNRKRVFNETIKLNGIKRILLACHLKKFLRRAEYKSFINRKGINKNKLS